MLGNGGEERGLKMTRLQSDKWQEIFESPCFNFCDLISSHSCFLSFFRISGKTMQRPLSLLSFSSMWVLWHWTALWSVRSAVTVTARQRGEESILINIKATFWLDWKACCDVGMWWTYHKHTCYFNCDSASNIVIKLVNNKPVSMVTEGTQMWKTHKSQNTWVQSFTLLCYSLPRLHGI